MDNHNIYPKTDKDYKFERSVDKWREKLPDILVEFDVKGSIKAVP